MPRRRPTRRMREQQRERRSTREDRRKTSRGGRPRSSTRVPMAGRAPPPPPPTPEQLRRKLIKQLLIRDPAWHVRDSQDRWVCPYCSEVTKIEIPPGGVDSEKLTEIVEHVSSCAYFDEETPEEFHPVDEVQEVVLRAAAELKLTPEIKRLVRESPLWQVISPSKLWICPYCRCEIGTVVVADKKQLRKKGPKKIASHMVRECQAYQGKTPPAQSVQILRAVALNEPLEETIDEEPVEVLEAVPLGGEPIEPFLVEDVTDQVVEAQPVPDDDSSLTSMSVAYSKAEVDLLQRKGEMQRELEQAREKQLSMLPSTPELEGFEFHVRYEPCDYLAGDFYDFIALEDGQLGIVIGDITGHGLNAALVMGMCKKVINMAARMTSSPAQTLILANQELAEDLDDETSVTLFYGVLDTENEMFSFARAGHEPLLLHNPKRDPSLQCFEPGGVPIGGATDDEFQDALEEREFELLTDDLFMLYTDGLLEATRADGKKFGFRLLNKILLEYADRGPKGLVEFTWGQVEALIEDGPLEDDVTILAWQLQ